MNLTRLRGAGDRGGRQRWQRALPPGPAFRFGASRLPGDVWRRQQLKRHSRCGLRCGRRFSRAVLPVCRQQRPRHTQRPLRGGQPPVQALPQAEQRSRFCRASDPPRFRNPAHLAVDAGSPGRAPAPGKGPAALTPTEPGASLGPAASEQWALGLPRRLCISLRTSTDCGDCGDRARRGLAGKFSECGLVINVREKAATCTIPFSPRDKAVARARWSFSPMFCRGHRGSQRSCRRHTSPGLSPWKPALCFLGQGSPRTPWLLKVLS